MSLIAALVASGGSAEEVLETSAEELLSCSFEKRYEHDLAQTIEVEAIRGDRSVRSYRLQLATRKIADQARSLAIFLSPPDQRGMKLLTIESDERRADHFLFVPLLRKVKRIYGGGRHEAFLGSEFSFEDMERQRVSDFEILELATEELGEESVRRVSVKPRYESAYAVSDYLIAPSDCFILEIRHHKVAGSPPFKVISTPRSHVKIIEGVPIATRSEARNLESGRSTVIRFTGTRIDPGFSRRYFEPSILERLSGLPGLPR